VVALDQSSAALDALRAQVDTGAHKLTTLCEPFENGAPLPTVELVNASFALPFCKPEAFTSLWTRIMECLRRGGLFSGHFFGLRDSWAGRNLTCHRYEQLLELFEDWELLELNEIEFDGKTATGQDKHWASVRGHRSAQLRPWECSHAMRWDRLRDLAVRSPKCAKLSTKA